MAGRKSSEETSDRGASSGHDGGPGHERHSIRGRREVQRGALPEDANLSAERGVVTLFVT
jgi:hypothetical protein